jgi:hypothetical protein
MWLVAFGNGADERCCSRSSSMGPDSNQQRKLDLLKPLNTTALQRQWTTFHSPHADILIPLASCRMCGPL